MQPKSSNTRIVTFMGKRISIESTDGAITSVAEATQVMERMTALGRANEDFVLVVTQTCYYEIRSLAIYCQYALNIPLDPFPNGEVY